jgi:hypothetical protein
MLDLYSFIYRGVLTEESLDRIGRRRRKQFGGEEAAILRRSLSFEMLHADTLADAQRMSVVYTAIHSFENMVRALVSKAMAEKHGEAWWSEVPAKIQKKAVLRMEEEAKFRWHGSRGQFEINYCDFGDLSSIIVTNWSEFESLLADLEWSKAVLFLSLATGQSLLSRKHRRLHRRHSCLART